MASTSVKFFHSAMPGAPVLSGTAGSLISVLDLLVTGMGLKLADSLVVVNGVATLTFSSGHSFEAHAVALVAGATPAALNGGRRILAATPNTATFAAPGVPDGAATGSITAKLAGAGWEKAFTGTNLAAYRSTHLSSTRMFLHVDDAAAASARVVGFESMSDVSTGMGPFPSAVQISQGGYWPKSNVAGPAARAWTLIADSRGFVLHTHAGASSGLSGSVWGFGDLAADRSGDAYACVLQCSSSDVSAGSSSAASAMEYAAANGGGSSFMPRSFTAVGSAVNGGNGCEAYVTASSGPAGSFSNPMVPVYPNPADNSLVFTRKIVYEPNVSRRGAFRGLLFPAQNCHAAFAWRDVIDGQDELSGRKLMAIKCGGPAGTSSQGVLFVDLTGPWGA